MDLIDMEHDFKVKYDKLLLRQLTHNDIELLRIWRNNKYDTRFLRPIGEITPEMQEAWFNTYLKNENELAMAIVECNELNATIGSVSLYDFSETSAEFGKFLIGDSRAHGKGLGRKSLVMLLKLGFEVLKFEKITAWVHGNNIPANTVYQKIGCRVVGERLSCVGGIEYKLEIDKNEVIKRNDYYDDIIIKD